MWELGLAVSGELEIQRMYERQILYTSSTGKDNQPGGLKDLRADSDDFHYGASKTAGNALDKVTLPANETNPSEDGSHEMPGALFYRMVSAHYVVPDPLMGSYAEAFIFNSSDTNSTRGPTWNKHGVIIWNDWKPITGENVWLAIIGPLQMLMFDHNFTVPKFTSLKDAPDRVVFALSVLPALKALASPAGAIYHCPKGAQLFPADDSEETNVSNENNFSALAALRMLKTILANGTAGSNDEDLSKAKADVDKLIDGIESYFKTQALSGPLNVTNRRVFYQGGHAPFEGGFHPVPFSDSQGFAVDCQTWGTAVILSCFP